MHRVAIQTQGVDQVDFGDSFTYQATIELPSNTRGDKSDIAFELFGLEPDKGRVFGAMYKILQYLRRLFKVTFAMA